MQREECGIRGEEPNEIQRDVRPGGVVRDVLLFSMLPAAAFASVTPYPAYPGAAESLAYKVTVDGQPVFVHRLPTYNQFQWMDHASFAMTGKVHVTITSLVNERNMCHLLHPAARLRHSSADQRQVRSASTSISRAIWSFSSTKSRPSRAPACCSLPSPPEKNPPKLGDPNVVNIMDYKVDNTGKTLETAKINQAISDVSARPGGGVLFFPRRSLSDRHDGDEEQRQALRRRGRR